MASYKKSNLSYLPHKFIQLIVLIGTNDKYKTTGYGIQTNYDTAFVPKKMIGSAGLMPVLKNLVRIFMY